MIKLFKSLPKPVIYALAVVSGGLLLFILVKCGESSDEPTKVGEGKASDEESIPLPNREFRAAWVATVDNIDWPSAPGLPVAKQKEEAVAILNRLVELNMNAVIFQVRPQADALYQSKIEPWSYFLTGEQGRAPEAGYDPLTFWIEEAHRRGLQLHAWFNPYRANHKANRGPISSQSIIKTNPELVVKLGDEGYWWMDPSQEAARRRTIDVVMDVVTRYDIDGVHFDDYFYPYPAYNGNQDFPDNTSYLVYRNKGGELSVGDWRRASVNQLIQEIYTEIKLKKKHVEFGISPFGIWRPGFPEGVAGMDQYEVLYADARLWLRQGWVDYFVPQLYWPISAKNQGFSDLLVWWNDQNLKSRHLWPGLTLTRARENAGATELVNQVLFTREVSGDNRPTGFCTFSMKWLMEEDFAGANALKVGPWSERVLIPATPWLVREIPGLPSVDLASNREGILLARFKPCEGESVFQFVLNERRGTKWLKPKIVPGIYRSYEVKNDVDAIAVRAVNRARNVSPPVVMEVHR